MDFKGKTFLVAGAGKSGIGACNLLNKVGSEVILYDENENLDIDVIRERLDNPGIVIICGALDMEKIKSELYGYVMPRVFGTNR